MWHDRQADGVPHHALGAHVEDSRTARAARLGRRGTHHRVRYAHAADVALGSGIRYGTMFKLVPERKEFSEYIARISQRPALKRAMDTAQGAKAA